jgi:N-glycosylase/DNA lyase
MEEIIIDKKLNKKMEHALKGYKRTWEDDSSVFEEMMFCILTPQSSARGAEKVINNLKKNNLLKNGTIEEIEPHVKNVRFYITKAKRLVLAREKFPKNKLKDILIKNKIFEDPIFCRDFLVKEINGYGMKEASHFLRNIGFYENVAILDRHILKNLVRIKVIDEVPINLTKEKYLEIENKMKEFCVQNGIDFAKLDLYFWSKETGEIFK